MESVKAVRLESSGQSGG